MIVILTSNGPNSSPQIKQAITNLVIREIGSFEGLKVAFIINAVPVFLRKAICLNRARYFKALGCDVQFLDLAEPFQDNRYLLSSAQIIYVEGGNTFQLQLELLNSGLSEQIVSQVRDKGKIYIGTSAGSIIATPDIQTAAWFGDRVVDGMEQKSWLSLGLVPFAVYPHFRTSQLKKIGMCGYELHKLKDGQAVVVDGNEKFLI